MHARGTYRVARHPCLAWQVLALRKLDMTKIESRPVFKNPLVPGFIPGTYARFNYIFYVDFVGKACDRNVQNALAHLRELAPNSRVLGSFPMDLSLGATGVEETMASIWDEALDKQ